MCSKVRLLEADTSKGYMDDIQKVQSKLFRQLNNSRLKDKISTKSITHYMLSVCYKSVQSLRVTCLFTGQYDTGEYGTIAGVLFTGQYDTGEYF